MKQFFKNKKNRILLVTAVIMAWAAGGLLLIAQNVCGDLAEQQMAERWSKDGGVAQVSCFFSTNAPATEDTVQEFEYMLNNYLQESSITGNSSNPSARLWIDSYSAEGRITLESEKSSLDADAMGVGGDFFLFHPQKMVCGNTFSGSDLNQDYCVIDEDAAWQLFGSNDVSGMMVFISGIPHIVTGVIHRPDDELIKAAGLDATRVYVSYHTLENYGTSHGINHYEILMPNPVKNFAYNYVKDNLGSEESETEVLENSTRFSLLNRVKRIRNMRTRSMNGKAIIYPYWENLARGEEDLIDGLTLLAGLLLIYPCVAVIILIVSLWRHKNWTFQGVCGKIKDSVYDMQVKNKQRNEEKKL